MPETNEELEVDIPTSGKDVEVEINASDVEEDVPEEGVELESSEEEHENYSKNVKKRIDKLTKKAREAEDNNKLPYTLLKVFKPKILL